jgi:TrmH family RNA methyltransferase
LATAAQLDRVRIVLVSVRNPLNLGAAARAMSNFGFHHLRVVNPYEKAFREARSAVGASSVMEEAEQFKSVADAVADCTLVVGTTAVRHRQLHHPLRRLEDGASLIRKRIRATSRVALLFGSEKFGLSNKDLSHCHWLMRIPTSDENISMNLGQAVAVCLYEIIRDAKTGRLPEKLPRAAAGDVERFTTKLLDVLHASGFLEMRRVADAEERIRRLVRRLNLPARDAVIWLGIMQQTLWKIRSAQDPKTADKDS